MGLMDSSRRNSIWAKKEKKAGARWLWSQIRPLVTQEGNTHLPPNVPSHNFENMDGEMDRAHVIVVYVSYHRTFESPEDNYGLNVCPWSDMVSPSVILF